MVLKSAVQLVISQCCWVCSQCGPYGTYYIRVLDTDLYVLEIFYCITGLTPKYSLVPQLQ